MGGGLFSQELYLNPKCLVFSAIIIAVYFLPHPPSIAHNIVMAFLLGMSAYVGLAWYDTLFNCDDRLKPTLLGYLSKWWKPQEYSDEYEKLPENTKKVISWFDYAVLSIIVLTFAYPFIFGGK